MPEVKEPYYYIKPKELIGEGPADLSYRMFIDIESEYRELFSGVTTVHQAIGEASAGYLYFYKEAIPQIKKDLGDVKIIILIRDPVARAYSSHIHHVREGREAMSFAKAWKLQGLRKRDKMWFGMQLRDVGLYADSIKAYMDNFSEVKVILNDDLQTNTAATVASVCEFLGVDPEHKLSIEKRHNENRLPRSWCFQKLVRGLRNRRLLPSGLADALIGWNLYKPKIDPGFAARIAPEFEEDIKLTSELIGRDLSCWLDK